MNPAVIDFIIGISAIVGGIIALKVFFSLWGILDRRWHPGKVGHTPETAFKDLMGKCIRIQLKNGDVIEAGKYEKTLFFNDGEMALNTTVYFQIRNDDGTVMFVSGSDILLIQENMSPSAISHQPSASLGTP